METILTPPAPFCFDQNTTNITTGALSENWNKWSNGFKIYFEACELSKKSSTIQVNILLHIIGEQCRDLYAQFNTKCTTVDEILEKFKNYFQQKKNLTVERHKFFIRNQDENESIEQYVYELKKLAMTCEFGDLCNSLIKDRLVCGILNNGIRERLLREADLTLEKAVNICQAVVVSKMYSEKICTEHRNTVSKINNYDSNQEDVCKIESRRNRNGHRVQYTSSAVRGSGRGGFVGRAGHTTNNVPRALVPGGANSYRGRTVSSYENINCNKCGMQHPRNSCPAYGKQCGRCTRMNHFSRMCNVFRIVDSDEKVIRLVDNLCSNDKWSVNLIINQFQICFKIDTGADVNVLPESFLTRLNISKRELLSTTTKLHGYSGAQINVIGKCFVKVIYKNNSFILEFKVAEVNSMPILGKFACEELKLVKRIYSIGTDLYSNMLDEYRDVFEGLGCVPGTYKIQLKDSVKPVVHAPRKIPIPIRDQVKTKLEEMVQQGIIAKVEGPTDWVNSITIVKKQNGDLRICLDPKELNLAIKREHFRLPTLEEILSNLSGAKYFSTLDASNGFWQTKLHPSCTDYCTFNTPFGRFKFLRMPYGICSASEVFHKKVHENFDDIEGVCTFVDDLLISGRTKLEHDNRLRCVLDRCRKINLKLNKSKCKFGLSEIRYLGHKITQNGLFPDESHVSAIINMPKPQSVKDLERFLGLVTYVGNFIPKLSDKTRPLRELLQKDIEWHWAEIHDSAFSELKRCLTKKPVLQFYSMNDPITISVDASKSGLGAVLMQNHHPVCYASKSLTKTEQRYAQIEKELYACVFACERFYGYIYGRTDIVIESDHKPLVTIIKKPIIDCPPRLQRMLLRLQPYTFKLVYKPGKELYIADTLSRAYQASNNIDNDLQSDITEAIRSLTVKNELTDSHFIALQKETELDKDLQKLKQYIVKGWPFDKCRVELNIKPYWNYRHELSGACGLLWRGNRIIIPKNLRREMLTKLHFAHLGFEKCLLRAKELLFWPELNNQLRNLIDNCQTCLTFRKNNSKEELRPHEIPSEPWVKVGMDLFYFNGINYLLIVDYHSKFIETIELVSTLSDSIIKHLKNTFSRLGIPQIVVSDCGPQFISNEFRKFAREWCFNHVTTSPRYPQSNGQSERAVQIVKNIMKKSMHSKSDYRLALLEYLNTPISENLPSPAEILQSRKLRSILPVVRCLHPSSGLIKRELIRRQRIYKQYYDRNAKKLATLSVGQPVKIKDQNNNKWISGTITKQLRERSYEIKLSSGNIIVRNRRHMIADSLQKHRKTNVNSYDSYADYDDVCPTETHTTLNSAPGVDTSVPCNNGINADCDRYYVTRFGRTVRPPDRWGY
ncbi:unnamed protein product [Arctia plantaginis]|uniref:RNA-directed DNA polymerase n=2 Tax=Arctia plantaginis TaxID=874455 RepID=A0A8S0YW17_ARCPL|nr:unnamed protein product [Arctia plantaginis]